MRIIVTSFGRLNFLCLIFQLLSMLREVVLYLGYLPWISNTYDVGISSNLTSLRMLAQCASPKYIDLLLSTFMIPND